MAVKAGTCVMAATLTVQLAFVAAAHAASCAEAATAAAQPLPPQAAAAHSQLMFRAKPAVRGWVQSTASGLRKRNLDPAAMAEAARNSANKRFAGQPADIDALVGLVMFEVAADARRDLKTQAEQASRANAALRQQQRAAEDAQKKPDSLCELGAEQQQRLQQAMDRRSKSAALASNLLKKSSDTSAQIIGNLK
jgi:hypothetical protein